VENAQEPGEFGTGRLIFERSSQPKPQEITRGSDHDFAFDFESLGELPGHFFAKNRLVDFSAHDEGADGADVDDVELLELLGELRGFAEIGSANVYSPQKHHG
jgi:hypothetical protein